jgi:glycosyltransferase involved in cell wall biosynthesis
MTGNVSDVRPVIAAMDVFVLPSLAETFSNAALEAMAMRVPVVLSKVGGATEMVRDGIDGYIVAPDRLTEELPQLLSRLAGDRTLRLSAGERARRRVEESFSFDAMVDNYEEFIRRFGRGQ